MFRPDDDFALLNFTYLKAKLNVRNIVVKHIGYLIFGALYPFKSGLMNKHIVKHSGSLGGSVSQTFRLLLMR